VTTRRLATHAYMIAIQIHGKRIPNANFGLEPRVLDTQPTLRTQRKAVHKPMTCATSERAATIDPGDMKVISEEVVSASARKTLDAIADGNASRGSPDLKFTPWRGRPGPRRRRLTRLLLPAFATPTRCPSSLRPISLALGTHIARWYGGMRASRASRGVSPLAGTARQRAHERKPSERCSDCRCRDGMLAIGRDFARAVPAFDGSVAAPMDAPTSD